MDNLCHSLVGMALGRAGLDVAHALGMSTLVIANNLPDIDVGVFAHRHAARCRFAAAGRTACSRS